jgi:protein-S-isoprenylcysteine O-methyltransferase Ste14
MKAFSVFLYSLISYAIGMGGLVWFILYQGDFLLPSTVNSGPQVSLADGLIINIGLILLWGVQHSIMARPGFKVQLTKLIPATAERSTYTLASGLCLIAIVFFWQGNATPVWSAPGLELPLRILSLAGWGLTVWATFEIDHFDLFGLKKPFCALRGQAANEKQFVTPFLYRNMRHPIQTGVLIGMWSQAVMSQGQFLLAVTMTVYVFIGLYFEERDLVAQFGNRYRSYMDQVPRLFPRPGKRISGADSASLTSDAET